MSVLVIGGAGYIGSHAAHALSRKGYEVIIYDNLSTGQASLAEGFELVVGDISDTPKLSTLLRRVDSVMHFAAHAYVGESVSHPRKYFQNKTRSCGRNEMSPNEPITASAPSTAGLPKRLSLT